MSATSVSPATVDALAQKSAASIADTIAMRNVRMHCNIQAICRHEVYRYYTLAGEANTSSNRQFWLSQVKRVEQELAQILAA